MASQQAKSRSHLNLRVPKTQIRTYWWCRACVYRKSDSAILVMKSAEDGRRYDAAHVLDCAIDRGVLVERPMSPQLIIISGILRQYPAQVRFAQNNYMVDTLASDRTDQPFGEAVLPRQTRGDRLVTDARGP